MANTQVSDKKGHVCPPSSAIHPADRWESLFVYSFICKFTNLRHKTEGLETPMDFEEALMSKEPNNIITQILVQFIVNLKPLTRNLSTDQISSTVASVLSEYLKTSERTIFWHEDLRANVDPFEEMECGFFATSWDFKLKILRQLVELQLTHAPEIKATIDNAWGVVHNKHKKTGASASKTIDPKSQQHLQLLPIGQDLTRKRYWVADDSPRIYISTNPWKITATFQTISSTREEYFTIIENLKSLSPPPLKKGQKRTKLETGHLKLIQDLEARIEAIDAELTRVAKARRKIEQKRLLLAQAEIRQTRTRRRTQKPDYVYNNEVDSEDDGDAYTYQEDDQQDDEYEQDQMDFNDGPNARRGRAAATVGTRRSTRTSVINTNGKRDGSSDSGLWRGERRSTRLGGLDAAHSEPPRKRARTEDSVESVPSTDATDKITVTNGVRVKTSGAAALKPTEIALEQIAGKKRSKFWVYAVEPIPDGQSSLGEQSVEPLTSSPSLTDTKLNSHNGNGDAESTPATDGQSNAEMDVDTTHSPLHSP